MPVRAEPGTGTGRSARGLELRLRIASAAIMVPLVLICAWAGGFWWLALVSFITAGCVIEWVGLSGQGRAPIRLGLLGAALILPAGVALAWLRQSPATGISDVLFLLLSVWASDIGAFAAGRSLGGPRLAPSVSPSKTWAGAAGGLLAAILAGSAFAWLVDEQGLAGGSTAAALAIAAQAGDLLESAAKRRLGVKDSGRLIPGHGGLLDRLDGLIAAAPVAAGLVMVSTEGLVWGR